MRGDSKPKNKPLHRVEYTIISPDGFTGSVTRDMMQADLAKLLMVDGVSLSSVNREAATFRRPKKKR